jgi:hypothetical protein
MPVLFLFVPYDKLGKPEVGLLIASVVLSLLLTVEGHKLPHPGLETRVQQHLPHTTLSPSDFHHAVPTQSDHSPFFSS